MQTVLRIAIIVLSALLVASVLLQGRGSGLGLAFGGDSNVYRTKRGLERVLFFATIVLAALLFVTTLATAIFS